MDCISEVNIIKIFVTFGAINKFKFLLISTYSVKSSSVLCMNLNQPEENEPFILTYPTG